jgi:putative glutamine amidotransferase
MLTVGVTARFAAGDPAAVGGRRKPQWGGEQALLEWLVGHGAMVAVLPPPHGANVAAVASAWVSRIDALVLQGGADVHAVDPASMLRDRFEVALLENALACDLPFLGICRGLQVLNVALGGSLRLLEDMRPDGRRIHSDPGDYELHQHAIRIAPDTPLASATGGTTATVCSMHRHGIDRLAAGLEVEAWCPDDDTVEAVRVQGAAFARAVQWHPEFQRSGALPAQPLLAALLAAAA